MRPKSTTLDLPSSHDVKTLLHNEFVKHMAKLKEEIMVSSFNKSRIDLHTLEGGTRKGLNYLRRVVGRYDEDGVYGNDRPLD